MNQQVFGQEQAQPATANLVEIFVEGAARMIELQSAATRAFLQTQGRSAAILGWPDWSRIVAGGDDGRNLFDTGARQLVDSLRETQRTLTDLQQQLGRIAQQQARQMTDQVRDTIEEIGRRGREGIEEWRKSAVQGTSQLQRAAQDVAQHGRETQQEAARDTPALIVPAAESTGESRAAEERARGRRNA